MVDNDGSLTFGGTLSIVAIVMAPVLLGIMLFKLFFRAPFAAILGALFCSLIIIIGAYLASSIVSGMNPLQGLLVMGLFLCMAAGGCYALMSAGWMQQFFVWECSLLNAALSYGGLVGRAFYIFAQIIPGILLLISLCVMLFGPEPAQPLTEANYIFSYLVLGWLAISQIVVYRFHRTTHPIGCQVNFTGAPLDIAEQ
jgi:hypothetical protein